MRCRVEDLRPVEDCRLKTTSLSVARSSDSNSGAANDNYFSGRAICWLTHWMRTGVQADERRSSLRVATKLSTSGAGPCGRAWHCLREAFPHSPLPMSPTSVAPSHKPPPLPFSLVAALSSGPPNALRFLGLLFSSPLLTFSLPAAPAERMEWRPSHAAWRGGASFEIKSRRGTF